MEAARRSITHLDFIRMFNLHDGELPEGFADECLRVNSKFRSPTQDEVESYVLNVLKLINSKEISRTLEQNKVVWEQGWQENLDSIDVKAITHEMLKPKYFRPSKILRFNKGIIVVDNPNIEYDLFVLARKIIFGKFLSCFDNIYELGCGSCQNLLMLTEMYPDKKLFGLDWTNNSVKIASKLAEFFNRPIAGIVFDNAKPSDDFSILPGSAVVTIHALEQIGNNFQPLLQFLLTNKPQIVVNYEPILEQYDHNNLYDYLAYTYSIKRNYLNGYWTALHELAKKKQIEIIADYRPYLGGIIHEASMIAWRPI